MGRQGGFGFLLQGGEELCAPGRGRGAEPKKSLYRAPKRRFMWTRKFTFLFLKNGILNAIFVDFYLDPRKNSRGKQGGVNKVSCRSGELDLTLQEGGNGTLPPLCPRMSGGEFMMFSNSPRLRGRPEHPEQVPEAVGEEEGEGGGGGRGRGGGQEAQVDDHTAEKNA